MQRIEGVKTPESAYCLHPQQKQMATLRTPRLNIWITSPLWRVGYSHLNLTQSLYSITFWISFPHILDQLVKPTITVI